MHVEKGRVQRRSVPLAFCSPLGYSHVVLVIDPELINNNSMLSLIDLLGCRSCSSHAWEGLHVEHGRAQRRSVPLAFCCPLCYSHVVLIIDPELLNNNSKPALNHR